MKRVPLDSVHLASAGYHDSSRTLEIEFNKSGVYQYFDVLAPVYEQLTQADSSDSFFLEEMRGVFRYART